MSIIPFRKKSQPIEKKEISLPLESEMQRIKKLNPYFAFWSNPSKEGLDEYFQLIHPENTYYWYGLLIQIKQNTVLHIENILDIPLKTRYHSDLLVQPENKVKDLYYPEFSKLTYIQNSFSEKIFIALAHCNTPSEREDIFTSFCQTQD